MKIFLLVILGFVPLIVAREMPQAMFDEMKASFFKFVDGNYPKAKDMISLKTVVASSTKEVKDALKDAKGAAGMASPMALIGQFAAPVGITIGQFPGRCIEAMASFNEFYTMQLEQLKKLPPFKAKDPRAGALKTEFNNKFAGYVDDLANLVQGAFGEFLAAASGFKKEFEPILQKSIGERSGNFFGNLNTQWDTAIQQGKATMKEKLEEFKTNLVALGADDGGAPEGGQK